jgi:hypothetical protein
MRYTPKGFRQKINVELFIFYRSGNTVKVWFLARDREREFFSV